MYQHESILSLLFEVGLIIPNTIERWENNWSFQKKIHFWISHDNIFVCVELNIDIYQKWDTKSNTEKEVWTGHTDLNLMPNISVGKDASRQR